MLAIAQKIVSKAEGRQVDLRTVTPSARAQALAAEVDKDPRLVELILRESTEVVRHRKGVLVVAHRCGTVLANAGIDASNVGRATTTITSCCCRRTATAPAARSARGLRRAPASRPASSSSTAWDAPGATAPSAWRSAPPACRRCSICAASPDLFGRELRSTQVGIADEIAAAASLLMGQADEGTPVVLVRGLELPAADGSAGDLIRARALDLFR